MKKSLTITTWIGIAASALMLVLVVLQFLPYWSYQGESVSIAGYVWRPHEYSTFTDLFRSYFGKKFRITLMFGRPMALTLAANLIGSVLCIVKASKPVVYLVPAVSGILGIYVLLTAQPYRLSGLWMPSLVLYALVLVLGIAGIILAARKPKAATVA